MDTAEPEIRVEFTVCWRLCISADVVVKQDCGAVTSVQLPVPIANTCGARITATIWWSGTNTDKEVQQAAYICFIGMTFLSFKYTLHD